MQDPNGWSDGNIDMFNSTLSSVTLLLVFSVYCECCVPAGVSARSFHQCFHLCSSVFNLQTATPGVRKHSVASTNQCLFITYHTQCAGSSLCYCLAGEAHWVHRCGWQHSSMGARVQRKALRQPGQAGVYRRSEISLLSWVWVHTCTSYIRVCVMFQVPAIRRCWFPTVQEP